MFPSLLTATNIGAFLDVDGTLLEIAPTPDLVQVPPSLTELLYQLWVRLDGALALVSGRPLSELDRLFSPYRFPGAGEHGTEVREANGCVTTPAVDSEAVRALHEFVASYEFTKPGVLVENKPYGVAVHYRLSPDAELEVANCVQTALARAGSAFTLQRGKCVFEIKPAGFTKGRAIRTLMERWPFTGRHPLFIGDDATDESGFEAVNLAGGTSIRVGPPDQPTLATYRLESPAAVHRFLEELLERGR
jgi:trehalose 6-phosphate phosphatase